MNKIIIALLTILIAFNANAVDGGYKLVGLGITPMTNKDSTTYGFGVSLGGGYNFNNYFGIEAQIGDHGIGSNTNISVYPLPAITFNGYIPINAGTSLFGKIGKSETSVTVGSGGSQTNYSGVTNVYGLGAEFSSAVSKDTYRIGIDHFDLGFVNGSSLSANYFNLSSTTHF
jgi:hypothetical protein